MYPRHDTENSLRRRAPASLKVVSFTVMAPRSPRRNVSPCANPDHEIRLVAASHPGRAARSGKFPRPPPTVIYCRASSDPAGALLLYGLYEGLRFVGVVYNLVAVGFVIMVFVIYFPRGLAGIRRSA